MSVQKQPVIFPRRAPPQPAVKSRHVASVIVTRPATMPPAARNSRPVAKLRKSNDNRRGLLGVTWPTWILSLILIAFFGSMIVFHQPQTPTAFDQPSAQKNNRLRSPWGVQHPI